MADLSYTVQVNGVQDLDKLSNTIDKLNGVLTSSKGSGKALEEVRRIIEGFKGSGSVFSELRDAVRELNSSASSLKSGFQSSLKELQVVIKQSMSESAAMMKTAGVEQGMNLAKGIDQSTGEVTNAVRRQGHSMAAAARAEATKAYEGMVMGNPNAKMTERGLAALLGLEGSGATLSPYHKNLVRQLRESGKRGNAAIVATVKQEQDELQAALKAMDERSAVRAKSLSGIYADSLARGNQDVTRVKVQLGAERKALEATIKQEQEALQAALQMMDQREATRVKSLAGVYRESLARGAGEIAKVKTTLAAERKEIEATVKIESAQLQAALKAMEDRDSVRSVSLAGIAARSLANGRADIARVKAELKSQADEIERAVLEQQARIRKSVSAAMNSPVGEFQRYNATTGMSGAVVDPFKGLNVRSVEGASTAFKSFNANVPKPADLDGVSKSLKGLGDNMNYAHSMSRGLASGFNLLWLTWGDLAPLFIGAAISNGFMQTAKQGMEVANTMAIIGNIGGNTAEEVGKLNERMLQLANQGPFGPLEIAEAMKTLSLAGLKANEILTVTQDVLNFSVAGTTSIEKAAETLVQVSTAFGLGSQGFAYASDVISKAAADSMTSVEAFSNAMKTASVIGQQYGVSLQDTALGIGTLANLGIQATAAGTALRNMYADLSGRSIKVSKILKDQGIELRNLKDGGFRPMIEVVAEMNEKLLKMDPISAKNFMQALLSERGAKGLVEMLRLIRTEAKDMGAGFKNALEEVRAGMEDNAAFSAITAAKMAQTAENQFKTMGSVLKASMQTAYKELEPELVLIFQRMQEVFSSPEFIAGITTIVNALGNMAKVFADHVQVLGAVALAYAALKTAQAATLGVYALMSAASTALARLTAAETAMTAAQTAALQGNTTARLLNNAAQAGGASGAGKALGALGLLGRAIPVVNVALGLGTAAWMAYEFWSAKSNDTAKEASDNYTNTVAKRLNDESEKIERINAMRMTGIKLTEAQAILDAEQRGNEFMAPALKRANEAKKAFEDAKKAQSDFAKTTTEVDLTKPAFASDPAAIKRKSAELDRIVSKAKKDFEDATIDAENAENTLKTAEARRRQASRVQNGLDMAEIAAQQKKNAEMFKNQVSYSQDGSGGRDGFQKTFIAKDNRLQQLIQENNDIVSMQKKLSADELAILQAKHQAGILGEGEYQAQVLALTTKGADAQTDAVLKGMSEVLKAAEDRKAYLQGLAQTATGPGAEMVKTELENLENLIKTFKSNSYNTITEVQSEAAKAVTVAAVQSFKELKKLNDSVKDFLRNDLGERRKARALFEIGERYKFINDSVFSFEVAQRDALEASTASMEKYQLKIDEVSEALNRATEALAELDRKKVNPESDAYKAAKALVDGLNATVEDLKKKAVIGAADAASLAFDKARSVQVTKFTNDIGDAISTALFEGGKKGKKKLRDLIVNELKKPITLMINATVNQLLGGSIDAMMQAFGMGGGGQQGLAGSIGSLASTAKDMYSLYSAFTGYSSSVNTLAGFLGMGQSAGAGAGTLGYANMVGSMGGDAIGAFQAANASWGGVSAGTTTATTATGGAGSVTGSTAGAAAGWAAGIGAGVFGGRAISGGYSALGSGSGNTAVNAGVAIGSIWGPIGAAIGGLIGGVVNVAFGKKLKEVGIEGTFGGDKGFEGNRYEFYKGGWFSGDKTKRKPLEEGIRQELAGQYAYLKNSAKDFANTLGINGNILDSFTQKFKVNLKGLSQEDAAAKIQAEFEKMGDAMADMLLGTKEYSRSNETSMQTLTRLSGTLKTVNTVMTNLGGTLYTVSLAGANSAQGLVDLFGGLENFGNAFNSYYQNFYSEQERTKNTTNELAAAMKTLGYTMPQSREEFRKIVDTVMALGEKGQPTLVALMSMQQAFADIYPEVDKVKDAAEAASEAFEKQIDSVKALADEVQRLSSSKKAAGQLVDRIDAAMGRQTGNYAYMREQELWGLIAKAGYEDQITMASELTDLVLARMELEKTSISNNNQFWKDTQNYIKSLTTGSLSPLTMSQKLAAAQNDFNDTLNKASKGDTDAQGRLQGTANAYLELARTFYASSQAYTDIFAAVTGGLNEAAAGGMVNDVPTTNEELQKESYDQLMQLRTIAANAYEATSQQLVTSQGLLAAESSLLNIQAQALNRAEEVKDLLAGLPAEIALRLPAFDASTFQQLGYNQARTVETLEAIRDRLLAAQEAGTAEAHMQAAIYVESMEKMLTSLADAISQSTQNGYVLRSTDRII